MYFRRGVYVSPPAPRLFPFTDKVWLPVGSSQRLKPYLSLPPGHDSRGYRLCLKVPSYLRYVAADSIEGARPQAVEAIDRGPDFVRLANALSALYPMGCEEKRLLDAMLLAVPR